MGYKTKDPKEVTELQKKGHNVIGMRQIVEKNISIMNGKEYVSTTVLPGLEYEFDFDTTLEAEQRTVVCSTTAEAKDFKGIETNDDDDVVKEEAVEQKRGRGRPPKKR